VIYFYPYLFVYHAHSWSLIVRLCVKHRVNDAAVWYTFITLTVKDKVIPIHAKVACGVE
jgi:hypothetical protein